jgi:hypothetical protein
LRIFRGVGDPDGEVATLNNWSTLVPLSPLWRRAW